MSIFSRDKKSSPQSTPQPAVSASRPASGGGSSAIETVIGPNTYVKGEVQGDGGMRIDGVVEGVIETTGNLMITESAKVLSDVKANNVSISGAVRGNISANRVEILDTGRVWGDLTTKSCLINEGAYLRGQIFMPQDLQPPQLEGPKASQEPASPPQVGTVVDIEPDED